MGNIFASPSDVQSSTPTPLNTAPTGRNLNTAERGNMPSNMNRNNTKNNSNTSITITKNDLNKMESGQHTKSQTGGKRRRN